MNPYLKSLHFKNQQTLRKWLTAKDIVIPNWELLEVRNNRLIDIFQAINKTLPIQYTGDVKSDVLGAYDSIRKHNLLFKMNNNGRSMEDVYYTWMQGYICEKVFTPFMCDVLQLTSLRRNGKDDITDAESFKRLSDADLVDETKQIMVEVQCGTHLGNCHIKKQKVDKALQQNKYTTYLFSFRLMHGTWCKINLNELAKSDVVFRKNELWENSLCWDIPNNMYKPYYGFGYLMEQ